MTQNTIKSLFFGKETPWMINLLFDILVRSLHRVSNFFFNLTSLLAGSAWSHTREPRRAKRSARKESGEEAPRKSISPSSACAPTCACSQALI